MREPGIGSDFKIKIVDRSLRHIERCIQRVVAEVVDMRLVPKAHMNGGGDQHAICHRSRSEFAALGVGAGIILRDVFQPIASAA